MEQNTDPELAVTQRPQGFEWSAAFAKARGFLILILVVSFAVQGGLRTNSYWGHFRGILTAVLVIATLAGLYVAIHVFRNGQGCAPVVLASVAFVSAVTLVGSYSLWLDLLCLVAGITVAGYVQAFYLKRSDPNWSTRDFKTWSHRDTQRYLGVLVLSTWHFTWFADLVYQRRPIALGPGSIETRYRVSADSLKPAIDRWQIFPRARVGLALSGGGYRAALLHAGVLSMLDSLGIRAAIPVAGPCARLRHNKAMQAAEAAPSLRSVAWPRS